jgi:hypothetical protein|tara:strand:+ start:5666 stop:5947 length:282 start_codon:yes stop_codon:yes gene_type:complete
MKKDYYDVIMDDKINALKDLPFQVKFMSMQILAWMWSAVFGIYIIESIYAFGISALAHALFITMTVLTAIYFRQVRSKKVQGILTRGKGGEHE